MPFTDTQPQVLHRMEVVNGEWYVSVKGDFTGRVEGKVWSAYVCCRHARAAAKAGRGRVWVLWHVYNFQCMCMGRCFRCTRLLISALINALIVIEKEWCKRAAGCSKLGANQRNLLKSNDIKETA